MNGQSGGIRAAAALEGSPLFQRLVLGFIVLGGLLVGLETEPAIRKAIGPALHALDWCVILFFTGEIAIRLAARGNKWVDYFRDPWNVFDFLIVALCWMPLNAGFAPVLRLLRVLRVLRLIPRLPQLQMLVGALLKSIPPMSYIAILLLLLFYVYAVAGVWLFGANDPLHFGSLPKAMLTLFQISTLENWSDVLRIQMLGSANFGYSDFPHLTGTSVAQPLTAVAYFVSFIMLGTMIVLNLLIGVIINSMTDARLEVERAQREKHTSELGRPSIMDELNETEQQLANLQKHVQGLKHRMKSEISRPDRAQ